jgi:ribose 5-phosphate isomerase B
MARPSSALSGCRAAVGNPACSRCPTRWVSRSTASASTMRRLYRRPDSGPLDGAGARVADTARVILAAMRFSVAADERVGVANAVVEQLRERGHDVATHGALSDAERDDWAWASEAAARDVAEGRADQAVVCCWTGTGASIAANKVAGVRAALCTDAQTADGARRWNDANALALSLRATSEAELTEILDAWLAAAPSAEADDVANVRHLREIEDGAP